MGKLIKLRYVGRVRLCIISFLLISNVMSITNVHAQDEQAWWFDVEFAVFKRQLDGSSVEDFSAAAFIPSNDVGMDLFSLPVLEQQTPYLSILNALPNCEPAPMPQIIDMSATIEEISATPIDALNKYLATQALNNVDTLGNPQNTQAEAVSFDVLPTLPKLKIPHGEFAQTLWRDIANLPQQPMAHESQVSVDKGALENEAQDLEVITPSLDISLSCNQNKLPPAIDKMPTTLFSSTAYIVGNNSIISEDALKMKTFVENTFRQRDIVPLLYTAWRQQVVFGEENARFVRIFAGEKLTKTLDDNVDQTQSTDNIDMTDDSILSVLNSIEAALGSNKDIPWEDEVLPLKNENLESKQDFSAFEVEGLFKVYLDYVNRVPYLHIDSEFMHYRMELDANGESRIEEFPFKQRRRIISKQIHYFDHPAIGILVRLHRYKPPVENPIN
ncbi:CsiV family protein [Agaribacter marinus]|uniref:Peptidoglycan-binding protein, CsiV n=1 Tax=Agaribacter marinus TaxID=1431249 RepID=A0AA37T1Z6_9ALTE|nr:CsiV family protein [Agaribacter marinus]GLR70180.1 hypothetical protein GCM10007852_10880 [Agaribacter marinus]